MSTPEVSHATDLAAERLGGCAVLASDEFFAPKENLLKPGRGVFKPDVYTDRGKWMDGWETRRRRDEGHDWCIVRLAVPGVVHGVVVDTNHFRGNHPAACSIDGCRLPPDRGVEALGDPSIEWHELLGKVALQGHHENVFGIASANVCTHVRLNIHPDGGVARLRVHGDPRPDWTSLLGASDDLDLVAALHGGRVTACSDMFFSAPGNLLMPHPPVNMGDGWETRRRRGPGHDWCVVRLGRRGVVSALEVDTTFFKGNYPARVGVERCDQPSSDRDGDLAFETLLPETPLGPDRVHRFDLDPTRAVPCTHLRLNMHPDGGISRFRAFGRPCTADGAESDDA